MSFAEYIYTNYDNNNFMFNTFFDENDRRLPWADWELLNVYYFVRL